MKSDHGLPIRKRRRASWTLVGLSGLALAPVPIVARAQVFLSEAQAVQLILSEGNPAGSLAKGEAGMTADSIQAKKRTIPLTDDQVKAIEKASGSRVRNKTLTAYVTPGKSAVYIDEVLGKHEFITIAVGLDRQGVVKGVEILEYRETFGYQVRNANWRKQFQGKTSRSDLKLGSDIKNISGATLSSSHITAAVKRLACTHEELRASL